MEINKPISATIVFVITLLVFFLFLFPKYQASGDLENVLAEKTAEYNGKAAYYARIAELTEIIEKNQDALEKIDTALPGNFSVAPLVYFLQKKGADAGLIVKLITLAQIPKLTSATPVISSNSLDGNSAEDVSSQIVLTDKQVKKVTFTMNVAGSYQALKNLLDSLDNSARLLEVNSISLKSARGQEDAGGKNQQQSFEFSLEIKTHTY